MPKPRIRVAPVVAVLLVVLFVVWVKVSWFNGIKPAELGPAEWMEGR